jgi:hypothetical protein
VGFIRFIKYEKKITKVDKFNKESVKNKCPNSFSKSEGGEKMKKLYRKTTNHNFDVR